MDHKTFPRRYRSWRRRTALATAITAVATGLLASTASAVLVQGQATVTPTSGTAGGSFTASATSARPSLVYYTHFLNFKSQQNSMKTCAAAEGVSHPDVYYSTSQTSSSGGNIAAMSRTIPLDIHPSDSSVNHATHPSSTSSTPVGPSLVCHITSGYGWATQAASATIT